MKYVLALGLFMLASCYENAEDREPAVMHANFMCLGINFQGVRSRLTPIVDRNGLVYSERSDNQNGTTFSMELKRTRARVVVIGFSPSVSISLYSSGDHDEAMESVYREVVNVFRSC